MLMMRLKPVDTAADISGTVLKHYQLRNPVRGKSLFRTVNIRRIWGYSRTWQLKDEPENGRLRRGNAIERPQINFEPDWVATRSRISRLPVGLHTVE